MSLHKNHSGNKSFYEQRPFLYIVLGVICFGLGKYSKIGTISGVILITSAAYILYMRKTYRDTNEQIDRLTKNEKKKSAQNEL